MTKFRSLCGSAFLVGIAALASCAPNLHDTILRDMNAQLSYSRCVPLGWDPVPIVGTYYPGYSAMYNPSFFWIKAIWTGSMPRAERTRPGARVALALMNELVKVGMMRRTTVPGGVHFALTFPATPYYYEDDDYGNNPEGLPYLCYARVVLRRLVTVQKVGLHRARVQFEWQPSSDAPWADDFIRAHSILLAPRRSPALGKLILSRDGQWHLESVYPAFPRVAEPDVWPKP